MKLVCISDTHGELPDNIPDGDVLIHAGDIALMSTEMHTMAACERLAKLPHSRKIFIAGNHDFAFENDLRFAVKEFASTLNLIYLEDSGIVLDGIKFYGSPVQPVFGDWAFNRDRVRIVKHWDAIPDDTDVLITHGPPHGILDVNLEGESCGCPSLLSAVGKVKPKIHIFGHIHEGYGQFLGSDTLFVNCSMMTRDMKLVNKPFVVEV